MQSDALRVNLNRVAVDDRGDAYDGDCSLSRWDRRTRSRRLKRRAYFGRSRYYDRGTSGSRQERRKERRHTPRRTHTELPRRQHLRVVGWCVGGGVELALCCDLRLASTDAKFVCAGVNIGLTASAYRLPRLIGVADAKHMLFTGQPYDGETAARFGLISDIHRPDELLPAALRLAERIASRAPLSVEASKRLASSAFNLTPQEALTAQATELATLIGTADHLTAVTAFLEKRTPCSRAASC